MSDWTIDDLNRYYLSFRPANYMYNVGERQMGIVPTQQNPDGTISLDERYPFARYYPHMPPYDVINQEMIQQEYARAEQQLEQNVTPEPKATIKSPKGPKSFTPRHHNGPWFTFKEKPMTTKKVTPKSESPSESVTPVAPTEAKPKREVVTYKVERNKNGFVYITRTPLGNLPSIQAFLAALAPKIRKHLEYYRVSYGYDIKECIQMCWTVASAEVWCKALADAELQESKTPNQGEFSYAAPALSTAYIAVDDVMYALRPVAMIGTNKALNTMRKKAKERLSAWESSEKARIQAYLDQMTNNALTNADRIIASAQSKLSEAERKLRDANNLPPDWLSHSGYQFYWEYNHWRVVLPCTLNIKRWLFEASTPNGGVTRTWKAKPGALSYTFYYSAAIDSNFSVTGMKIIPSCNFQHPHITTVKSCMQPADAPRTLKSAADIERLMASVNRTLEAVDMDSMLPEGRNFSAWDERLIRFIPDDLYKLLFQSGDYFLALTTATRETERLNPPAAPATPGQSAPPPSTLELQYNRDERRETWTT